MVVCDALTTSAILWPCKNQTNIHLQNIAVLEGLCEIQICIGQKTQKLNSKIYFSKLFKNNMISVA